MGDYEITKLPDLADRTASVVPGSNLSRLWNVARYYPKQQMLQRAISIGKRTWAGGVATRSQLQRGSDCRPTDEALACLAQAAQARMFSIPDADQRADRLLAGEFHFLNHCKKLGELVPWDLRTDSTTTRLWRFHLHYQDYLLELGIAALKHRRFDYRDRAWQLVEQWMAGNRGSLGRDRTDAWHPYCVSRRIAAWVMLWSLHAPPDGLETQVTTSLFEQAAYLANNLEWDIRGNHLLVNLKALVIAGRFFGGDQGGQWLSLGVQLLIKELDYQVLPHGEHFERSPMYHLAMLELVLDVCDALNGSDWEAKTCATFYQYAVRMAGFSHGVSHPDGGMPLLADSAFDGAPSLAACRRRLSGPTGATRINMGGTMTGPYWTYRSDELFLLFDAGVAAADDLPAHGHADLLTIEASWRGRRFIVDSGVYNYEEDAMRDYCRGTAGHNTLEIDAVNQCDVWSRFRMGRRGHSSQLSTGVRGVLTWARASHDAYRNLGKIMITRWVGCSAAGFVGCMDRATGSGRRTLRQWLHFHPDTILLSAVSDSILVELHSDKLRVNFFSEGKLEFWKGWYCPEFGVRLPSLTVSWTTEADLPTYTGWWLAPDESASGFSTAAEFGGIQVSFDDGVQQVKFDPFCDQSGSAQEPTLPLG
ncbi:MAG: alginate lyase family protein [Pirellulaceae bacterium]|nr:alginate lyase family protein [Planctomycetales bacterium]